MYKQLHVFASIEVSCFLFVSLQVMVFENLFVFRPVSEEVTELLLRLIGDAQMEVGWWRAERGRNNLQKKEGKKSSLNTCPWDCHRVVSLLPESNGGLFLPLSLPSHIWKAGTQNHACCHRSTCLPIHTQGCFHQTVASRQCLLLHFWNYSKVL